MRTVTKCKNLPELMATIEKKVRDALVYEVKINTNTYEITCEDTSEIMSQMYKDNVSGKYTGD